MAKGKEKKSNGFAYISFDDMKMEERQPNICLDSLGSVARLNLILLVENFWGSGQTLLPEFITISPLGKLTSASFITGKFLLQIYRVGNRISLHRTKNCQFAACNTN